MHGYPGATLIEGVAADLANGSASRKEIFSELCVLALGVHVDDVHQGIREVEISGKTSFRWGAMMERGA